MDATTSSVFVQNCLDRLRAGDATSLDQLIERSSGRLRHLATKMLGNDFHRLTRWADADDVFQSAVLRLCRSLKATIPDNPTAYYRLANTQIRRELLDLARHFFGEAGCGARHASTAAAGSDESSALRLNEPATETNNPNRLAEWTDFHTAVANLPEPERDVFELLWYQELSQDEAADLLGVDVRTVQRRWREARLQLHRALRVIPSTTD